MANLNETDAINQVKEGSLEFTVGQKSISDTKKEFIEAKIRTLHKDIQFVNGEPVQLAIALRHSYFNYFFGSHLVYDSLLKFFITVILVRI